jgi:phosphoglycerate-specific signal transduction histidine kinase
MLKNMKVGTSLFLGFLVLSLLGSIVAGIGIYNMGEINHKADQLYDRELVGISHIKEANVDLIKIGRAQRNVLLAANEDDRKKHAAAIGEYQKSLKSRLDQARTLFVRSQTRLTAS